MPDFASDKSYPGVVNNHYWFETEKGSLGLQVEATMTNPQRESIELRGVVWLTEKTITSPGTHPDGTPKRCQAERALNAIGYKGTLRDARGINPDGGISLIGNTFSAALGTDSRSGDLIIAFFNQGRASKEAVSSAFDTLLGGGKSSTSSPSPTPPAAAQRRPEDGPPPDEKPEDKVPF